MNCGLRDISFEIVRKSARGIFNEIHTVEWCPATWCNLDTELHVSAIGLVAVLQYLGLVLEYGVVHNPTRRVAHTRWCGRS